MLGYVVHKEDTRKHTRFFTFSHKFQSLFYLFEFVIKDVLNFTVFSIIFLPFSGGFYHFYSKKKYLQIPFTESELSKGAFVLACSADNIENMKFLQVAIL